MSDHHFIYLYKYPSTLTYTGALALQGSKKNIARLQAKGKQEKILKYLYVSVRFYATLTVLYYEDYRYSSVKRVFTLNVDWDEKCKAGREATSERDGHALKMAAKMARLPRAFLSDAMRCCLPNLFVAFADIPDKYAPMMMLFKSLMMWDWWCPISVENAKDDDGTMGILLALFELDYYRVEGPTTVDNLTTADYDRNNKITTLQMSKKN